MIHRDLKSDEEIEAELAYIEAKKEFDWIDEHIGKGTGLTFMEYDDLQKKMEMAELRLRNIRRMR